MSMKINDFYHYLLEFEDKNSEPDNDDTDYNADDNTDQAGSNDGDMDTEDDNDTDYNTDDSSSSNDTNDQDNQNDDATDDMDAVDNDDTDYNVDDAGDNAADTQPQNLDNQNDDTDMDAVDNDDTDYSTDDGNSDQSNSADSTQVNDATDDMDAAADDDTDYNVDDGGDQQQGATADSGDNQDNNSGEDDMDAAANDDTDYDLDGGGNYDDNSDDSSGEDASSDSGMDSGDGNDPREKLRELEKEIFDQLSDQEKQIKIKELKSLFTDFTVNCDSIIDKANNIPKTVENIKVIDFINKTLIDLKKYSGDYLINTFDLKTYIENLVQFQKFLSVLDAVKNAYSTIKDSDLPPNN